MLVSIQLLAAIQINQLIDWLVGWLIDWLIDWLIELIGGWMDGWMDLIWFVIITSHYPEWNVDLVYYYQASNGWGRETSYASHLIVWLIVPDVLCLLKFTVKCKDSNVSLLFWLAVCRPLLRPFKRKRKIFLC